MYREKVCFLLPAKVSSNVFLAIHKAAVARHLTAGSQGLNILCHWRNVNEMILHPTYFNCQTTLNSPPSLTKNKKKIKLLLCFAWFALAGAGWLPQPPVWKVLGPEPSPCGSVWCQCLLPFQWLGGCSVEKPAVVRETRGYIIRSFIIRCC